MYTFLYRGENKISKFRRLSQKIDFVQISSSHVVPASEQKVRLGSSSSRRAKAASHRDWDFELFFTESTQ